MTDQKLQSTIDAAWDARDDVNTETTGEVRDAVEAALKCAQIVTGRPGVIAFDGAYHGLSYGALSVTARADFRDPFTDRLAVQTEFLPFLKLYIELHRLFSLTFFLYHKHHTCF